jgi:type IV pilus assembly protein PilW
MSTHRTNRLQRKAQRGFTLVEIMIALLLGLVLTGGAIQIFVSNRATYAFNEGLSRVQENGRFALDTLSYGARMAGYFGCLSASELTLYNNLNSSTTLPFDFAEGITGFEYTGTEPDDDFAAGSANPANSGTATDWEPDLPAEIAGSVIPGSDVLVIRNVSPASHTLLSPFHDANEVVAGALTTDYAVGDIGIVSNCQRASIFQITGIADSTVGLIPSIDVTHTAAGTPGNATAAWGSEQEYGAGAQLMRGETWVYYVGARVGGGPPALFQRRLQTTSATTTSALVAEELVESVDTMQILYGIDAEPDGDLDSYVTADAVADWADVVTVRVALLMRSPEEYGTEIDDREYLVNEMRFDPFDDRRVRQVFTTTAAIRNRLP